MTSQAAKTSSIALPGGLAGTAVTVQKIIQTIRITEKHPLVYSQARDIARDLPSRDKRAEALAIYRFAKTVIRYTDDPVDADTLIEPQYILAEWHNSYRPVAADCVSQTILIAVLARNLGIPVRLRIIGSSPAHFHHIHPELNINGSWYSADVTAHDASSRKVREAAGFGYRHPAPVERVYPI